MKRPRPPSPPSISAAAKPPLSPPPTPILKQKLQRTGAPKWLPLKLTQTELTLPLTFPTGQTFRWKQTGPVQYSGSIGPHLVSLRQRPGDDDTVSYCLHRSASPKAAELALLDFLNAEISLAELWSDFEIKDPRFGEVAKHLGGARVLRQDPLECLIQFLCSSNNNIARITKMVDFVSSLGLYLGEVEGFEFHQFPSLERLSRVSEDELRKAGFGYRSKYITGTVSALQSKPGGGDEWLLSLRKLDLQDAIAALCTLPGVGPKVAACIALFSLDQHSAIPVDTHVWQIATRYLVPDLAGAKLTLKLCSRVAEAFVSKYGEYAGWAQTLLFIAELPAQKALLQSSQSIQLIFEYNGSAVVAMVGKNCFAIASDRRLGVQLQTIATDFQRISKIHDRVFIGLSGLATDVQTLYQRLVFRHKLYQLREERDMKPETFASLVSAILYEKRFGPYLCQPVIAGLGEDDKPFICTMDSIGAKELAKDFVVSGTASESLYGACEAMYKPDMEAEELFETISQALLLSVDRDCLSGWGGHVYVVTPTEIKERILKGRMD
ncbi:unnamed protein product [Brassica oleracea]